MCDRSAHTFSHHEPLHPGRTSATFLDSSHLSKNSDSECVDMLYSPRLLTCYQPNSPCLNILIHCRAFRTQPVRCSRPPLTRQYATEVGPSKTPRRNGGPRFASRDEVYRARNRSLLMYTSAVVRLLLRLTAFMDRLFLCLRSSLVWA